MQSGVEGIEMSMGDDLGAWDNLGTNVPGLSRGAIYESMGLTAYEVVFAPLDSPRAGNIIPKGQYQFSYRLALPYVRKNMVPLELASAFLCPGFETRWPAPAYLKEQKKRNMGMLRLHNDGDQYNNGIFWRDTDYPPYPEDEMKKMDQALADSQKIGIPVVPYFSVKEYHPETAGFQQDAERFARQVIPGEKFLENFFGTSLFGMQMCLCSDWYETRRKTIEVTLDNHLFSGVYYDWCMGLECINPAHNHGRRHWDNDQLLRMIEWSRQKVGEQGKVYLHLTNVPSYPLENMANMVLTEESVYSEIFPEMFTPHVHFLNIAPRSICVMLPDASPDQMRALTLAALLHHATLCTCDLAVLDFYKKHEKLLQSLCKYNRHSAPGEGITCTGSRQVGMSLYWKNKKALALLANLSNQEQTGDWSVKINGKTICGTATIPPLELQPIEIEL